MKKFILYLFLLPTFCFGQGAHRIGQVVVKGNGITANVGPGAKILVCVANTGCATAANIYLDSALTTPAANPVTADGSGNYDYYIASGCVDEQISSPGQGIIFVPNVCPFNGQGGGGSGNVLPTPQYRLFLQPNTGTQAVAGGAAQGQNGVAPILQGNLNPDLYATGGGNNGIANAFASADCTINCAVIVPPTSTDTEAPIMPTKDNSVLFDQRLGRHLRAVKNPSNTAPCSLSGGGDASGDCLNLLINNITNRGWGDNTFMKYAGPGYNLGYSPNTPQTGMTVNAAHETYFEADTRGISQIFGSTMNSHAIGDKAMSYNYLYTDGGQTDGSGEGNIGATYRVQENVTYYHGTITSGGTTGSVLLTTHSTSGQNAFTDGGYLLDITQGGVTGTISSVATVMGYGVWNFASASMPVSTAWGTFNTDTNSAANGQFQIPVSQTINMTLGTSPASPGNFVVGTACLVNGFVETVPITAVGTTSGGIQSVTFSTRYAWKAGSLIMQGGMCGQYLTNTAASSWRTAIAAVGSFSATQVVLGACSHGSCNNASYNLASVVGTTGDSITQYPGAEIIGTNGGQSNTVQLGYNTTAWANGDVIEGPHPPAVNMSALKIYANQFTKSNDAGSNLLVESWSGVNPGGSLGLNQSFLSLTDGSKFQWFWRIVSGDSTAKIGSLFTLDVPVDSLFTSTAPAQDITLFNAYQTAGPSARTLIISHGSTGDYEFRADTSGLANITAANVPPVGTLGQIPIVTTTTNHARNYNPVSVSGDAMLSSTGALTLATVNSGPGSCGDATHVCQVGTNGKGLVTSQTAVSLGTATISVNGVSHPDNTTVGIDGTGKLSTKGFTGSCASTTTLTVVNGVITGCS